MPPMSRPEKTSWPTVVMVPLETRAAYVGMPRGTTRLRARVSRQRWLQFGSGTMTGSVVASLGGNT